MLAFPAWPGRSGRESSRFFRLLAVSLCCGLVTVTSHAAEPKLLEVPTGEDWKIEIIPGPAIGPSPSPKAVRAGRQAQATKADDLVEKLPPLPAAEAVAGVVAEEAKPVMPAGINPASYTEVYNSIPFRRSEYVMNPSYRHDATIELLLGQIRPKTITNVVVGSATCCSPYAATFGPWINPWATKNFYYHYHNSRPTGYWVW